MLGTIVRRVTIATLDRVVDKGRQAPVQPVRWAADLLDRARGVVGLDVVVREAPLPAWSGSHAPRPMWESDRKKLEKWQIDQGILRPEEDATPEPAAVTEVQVKVYYKRGCPYARAALDLLREREIPFDAQDVKGDETTLSWLKIVTGKKTTPQIFVRGEAVGGYDELRALDQSGELQRRLQAGERAAPAAEPEEEALEISAAELRERLEDGTPVLLLDVRTEAEVRAGVIEGAVHIPLDGLAARRAELDAQAVWIAYCAQGVRSQTAAQTLRDAGFRSVVSLRGGVAAFRAAGGELVPRTGGPKRVSLPVAHPERSPFEDWAQAADAQSDERLEGEALVARVREVLDECRPLVQADGGDIELLDVQGDVVHVRLTGNCVGCPSSQATLRQGIERRLKSRIPQIEGIASPQLQPGA